jgi:hypothetical protein
MTRYYEPGEDPEMELLGRLNERLKELRLRRRERVTMYLTGVACVGVGLAGVAFVLQAVWRGYIKTDAENYTYASESPFWFYLDVGLLGGMAAFMAYLGVGMLLDMRREARADARLTERLEKLDARRRG